MTDHLDDCYGMFQTTEQRILLANGLSAERECNTVIHEMLHALWDEYKIGDDDDQEERAVNSLANGLVAVLRHNPAFLKYIVERCK